MRIFRKFRRALVLKVRAAIVGMLSPPTAGRWLTIYDSYTGAWQQDVSLDQTSIVRYAAVFRCVALIAGDVGKLPIRLIDLLDGVWQERVKPHPYVALLRRPNPYQTRLEFISYWLCSLLLTGNTYVLKNYDGRGTVTSMTVLDPNSVSPMVAPDGSVFYRLAAVDFLHLLGPNVSEVILPARFIIHDKYLCLNHPLIGCSPLQVAGAAAMAGYKIVTYNASFFSNQARPSGVLESPEEIDQAQADALKAQCDTFTSTNSGKVAVLEHGIKYVPLSMKSTDAQMMETLKFSQEDVARAFGVPAWLIGAGTEPTAANAELRMRGYYSQCLQVRMESIELLLDEALGFLDKPTEGLEFDTETLLRMDSATRIKTWGEAIARAIMTPNEARAKEGLKPKPGGDALYMQQQNFSLEALQKRDAKDDPFASAKPAAPPAAEPGDEPATAEDVEKAITDAVREVVGSAA